jgi:hypothetical protein
MGTILSLTAMGHQLALGPEVSGEFLVDLAFLEPC